MKKPKKEKKIDVKMKTVIPVGHKCKENVKA